MSFLKITDPAKRDAIVKESLEPKKNIRSNLLQEKVGEVELQKDLSKLFKPITEAQKELAKSITEELKPIEEGIENLPNVITFPTFPAIKATSEPKEREGVQYIDDLAQEYLMRYARKGEADTTFGITSKGNKFYIGDRNIKIKGNDIEVLDNGGNVEEKYKGTPGLWGLIALQKPENYTNEDKENYKNLLLKTNAVYRGTDPNSNKPAGNGRGHKWKNFIKRIWDDIRKSPQKKTRGQKKRQQDPELNTGTGIVVIPSDPNALLERLDLLLASQDAGHTGVSNELVSICDQLKRQGIIDADTYKKLNSYIKK